MLVNQNADNYDRKTEEYIVAYLDLLGITKRIEAIEQQELAMNKLHKFIHIFYESYKRDSDRGK
jgi:hypothetical protein